MMTIINSVHVSHIFAVLYKTCMTFYVKYWRPLYQGNEDKSIDDKSNRYSRDC